MAAMKKESKDGGGSKSFSFKFSKSKKPFKSSSVEKNSKFIDNVQEKEDVDYILATEDQEFKSVKPKKEKSKLVIPMIKNKKLTISDIGGHPDAADKEAANELLKELENGIKMENEDVNVTIPLLMRNKLPVKDAEHGEKLDVSLMPSESKAADYEEIPVTSFGAAMLRGMGWNEGEAIGLTNKGLTEPIEYIPRHKGLGLGAEKRQEEMKQRRRKLGDTRSTEPIGPIVEKSGKVRHFKGVGETLYKHPKGYVPGSFCLIDKGIHKGVYGKIIAVDEDNARITVKLTLGQQQATISQYNVTLVDEDEYRNNTSAKRKQDAMQYDEDIKKTKIEKSISNNHNTTELTTKSHYENTACWLFPSIRVRVISKSFKKGLLYYKKVEVVDVVDRRSCVCRTDEGRLIEDVKQDYLETVIPKKVNAYVMVVDGKYKGQIAKLVDKDTKKCQAHIQLLANKHVTKQNYDSICEYLGTIGDDDFL